MSLTNAQVHERFLRGAVGANGHRSMRSEELVSYGGGRHGFPGERVGVALYSYDTCIAIRRDSDGALFANGHRFSVTTSGHHALRGTGPGSAEVSFICAGQLAGRGWYREAKIVDTLPEYCHSRECRGRHEFERGVCCDAIRIARAIAGDDVVGCCGDGIRFPPDCYRPGVRGHARDIDQGWTWTLLRLPEFDMLCGSEYGRTHADDQLFAIRLRERAASIADALSALNPFPTNRLGGVLRQGELFFAETPWRITDRAPGVLRNTAIPQVGAHDGGHPHITTRLLIQSDGRVLVRGCVRHEQHRRLRLGDGRTWYEVRRANDAGAVSSPLSHWMGHGRAGQD